MADLVIIPVQGSHLDARQAARAIKLIDNQQKATRRKIPYAVLFTRTSPAITPRTLRHIQEELHRAGVSTLKTQIADREAFRAIFSFGGTVEGLAKHDVTNLKAAVTNARTFAAEVVERLIALEKEEAA
jgi:chromosome partitioning protein